MLFHATVLPIDFLDMHDYSNKQLAAEVNALAQCLDCRALMAAASLQLTCLRTYTHSSKLWPSLRTSCNLIANL